MADLFKRTGSPNWYVNLRDPREHNGLGRRSTGTRNKGKAREVARCFQDQVDAELAAISQGPRPGGLTWLDAATRHLELAKIKPSTRYNDGSRAAVIAGSCLGDFDLNLLTHEHLKAFALERRRTAVTPTRMTSDATIRRMISLISAVYTTVMDHELEGAPTNNPARTFDRRFLKESPPVDQQLRPQQFQDVLDSCKTEEHRRILVVLATTGMRAGELKGLMWEEVDLKNLVIEFGNLDSSRTKRGRSRRIPILPAALEALTAQFHAQYGPTPKGRAAGLVFPNPLTGEERASLGPIRRAVQKRAGVKGYKNHALRHTFASWSTQGGVDPLAIRDVLGHTTLSITTRYARHASDSALARFRQITFPVTTQFHTQCIGLEPTQSEDSE